MKYLEVSKGLFFINKIFVYNLFVARTVADNLFIDRTVAYNLFFNIIIVCYLPFT